MTVEVSHDYDFPISGVPNFQITIMMRGLLILSHDLCQGQKDGGAENDLLGKQCTCTNALVLCNQSPQP